MVFIVIVYGSSKEPRLHGVFSSEDLAKKSILDCKLIEDPDNVLLIGKVEVDVVNDMSVPVEDIDRNYFNEECE